MNQKKERPILFNGEMVRAIREDRKTQTRRILQVPGGWALETANGDSCRLGEITNSHPKRGRFGAFIRKEIHPGSGKFQHDIIPCPYGKPGDLLWVRETWRQFAACDECGCSAAPCGCPDDGAMLYRADGPDNGTIWRPSIHMPRWASRITLEITDVRVERLRDISKEDAKAEGVERHEDAWTDYMHRSECHTAGDARSSFCTLWESINGPGSWSANPWVWVIELRRIDKEQTA